MGTIRKQHRFATVPEDLLFDPSISCGARTLYAVLDRHADREGEAYPGMKRIASILGVKVDTARGYREELQASGWLINQGQVREDGVTGTNRYLLVQVREGAEKWAPENAAPRKTCTTNFVHHENGVPNDSPISNESHKYNERVSADASTPKRPHARNLPWDELAKIGGHQDGRAMTKFFTGMISTCLKQLRDAEAELDDQELAHEIVRRAAAYRKEWGSERLTPGALVKHWSRFADRVDPEYQRPDNTFVPPTGIRPGETQAQADLRRATVRLEMQKGKMAMFPPGHRSHEDAKSKLPSYQAEVDRLTRALEAE